MYAAERIVKWVKPPDILEVYLNDDLKPSNSAEYVAIFHTAKICQIKRTSIVMLVTNEELHDGNTALVNIIGLSAQACISCRARPGNKGFGIGKETCKAYKKRD